MRNLFLFLLVGLMACGSSTSPPVHPVLRGAVLLEDAVIPSTSTTADVDLLGLATVDNLDPNGTAAAFYIDGNPPHFLGSGWVNQDSHDAVAPHMHFSSTIGVAYLFKVCAVNSKNQLSDCGIYGGLTVTP